MTPDCDVTTFETWRLKAENDGFLFQHSATLL
jgi:hypothetical protein